VLEESTAATDPFVQFRAWFDDAVGLKTGEPNAMALATVDGAGHPSVRMVLLKKFDESGFVFFTNYESRKGIEIAANARVALLLYWDTLERQIRIEGRAAKTAAAESDEYFFSRPRGAQVGAIVSPQSRRVGSRAELEEAAARRDDGGTAALARPAHWGGYRVTPDRFEFWQGRADRLHDRLVYELVDDRWQRARLAP